MRTVKDRDSVKWAFLNGEQAKHKSWYRCFVSNGDLYYWGWKESVAVTKFPIAKKFNISDTMVILIEPEFIAESVGVVRHCAYELFSSISALNAVYAEMCIYEECGTLEENIEKTMQSCLYPTININKKKDRLHVLNMEKSIKKLSEFIDTDKIDPLLHNEFRNKAARAEVINQKRQKK